MEFQKEFQFGSNIILPVEDDILFPKAGTSSGSSNLCILEEDNDRRELPEISISRNEFFGEDFFGESVLNMNGGLLKTNDSGRDNKYPDFLGNYLIQEFVENDVSNSLTHSIKPVNKTDNLVKLMHERKSFYESRKNIIIAQKPYEKIKGSGRLSFEMEDINLIEEHSSIKMFLRDAITKEIIISDLTIPEKNTCPCFKDHNKALFCVRSRYDDVAVQWSENKGFANININVVDDTKFELMFAPLVCQSVLKNPSAIIMQLVFQMENDCEILEQSYFIKFCAFPSRDIKYFMKTLVKVKLVEDSFLEKITNSPLKGRYNICRVELDEKYQQEFKKYIKSISGDIAFE